MIFCTDKQLFNHIKPAHPHQEASFHTDAWINTAACQNDAGKRQQLRREWQVHDRLVCD
jgi:hypothetical protein